MENPNDQSTTTAHGRRVDETSANAYTLCTMVQTLPRGASCSPSTPSSASKSYHIVINDQLTSSLSIIKENLNFNSLPLQLHMLLTVSVSISSFPFSSSLQLAASGLAFQTLVPPGLCDACRRGLISRVKVYWFLTLS